MHHAVGIHHSQRADLCSFTRLWINLVLNIYTLPIALKQLLQILLLANEFLACAGGLGSISDLLLLSQLAECEGIISSSMLCRDSMLSFLTLMLFKLGGPSRAPHFPLVNRSVILRTLVPFVRLLLLSDLWGAVLCHLLA